MAVGIPTIEQCIKHAKRRARVNKAVQMKISLCNSRIVYAATV
jgi:hypothetical protein